MHKLLVIVSIMILNLGVFSETVVASKLLVVSFDATRGFFAEANAVFIQERSVPNPEKLSVYMSHAGSGKQARSVIDGLPATVVSLALEYDVDKIASTGLIASDWQARHSGPPFISTIVFLVRKGNPLQIRNWTDLIRPGVSVITPNPKSSGGARWNYLAAWSFATQQYRLSGPVVAFMKALFSHVKVMDASARGATTTFVERGIGDVLITWESEALLVARKLFPGDYEVVYPSVSVSAELPVTWVDKNIETPETLALAKSYVQFMYSKKVQRIAATHYLRPTDPVILAHYSYLFPALNLSTIKDFGGWALVNKVHFSDGGMFDQVSGGRR